VFMYHVLDKVFMYHVLDKVFMYHVLDKVFMYHVLDKVLMKAVKHLIQVLRHPLILLSHSLPTQTLQDLNHPEPSQTILIHCKQS